MDLPKIRRKPTYETIFQALKTLHLKPASWDDCSLAEVSNAAHDATVNAFLMSVISCDFDWLAELRSDNGSSLTVDEQKENLVQEASKRMAERCGRSGTFIPPPAALEAHKHTLAAGEMTRTWVIPESATRPEISFLLREPPLTGDNLGLKTWGTSYVISKKLEYIGSEYLGHLINKNLERPRILELGAGTGLVSCFSLIHFLLFGNLILDTLVLICTFGRNGYCRYLGYQCCSHRFRGDPRKLAF